jgi:thiamine-phosphate pyrophosphorylase
LLLFYITDRTQFPGDEPARQRALLAKIAEATCYGVDLIQLREKDLPTRQLEALVAAAVRIVHPRGSESRGLTTRFLINSRSDIAIACGADGVHLRADDISPSEVQRVWAQARQSVRALVSVSCHSVNDVAGAASDGADFALLAPVFEKNNAPQTSPAGLDGLREACRHKIPVLALGGVTLKNARASREMGAAGVAGIRLFQENDIAKVIRLLKG